MIIDTLNAVERLSQLSGGNIKRLGSIVPPILRSLRAFNADALEAQAEKGIAAARRRFGRGALLLGPFGFFHPSELISVIADNAKRGRLSKHALGCPYVYDFYENGEIARITFKSNHTKAYCETLAGTRAYLTYWFPNGEAEIADTTLLRYYDNGLLETMLQISLFDEAKKVGHIELEMYEPLASGRRVCQKCTLFPTDEACKSYDGLKRTYEAIYDDGLKVVDYEYLGEETLGEFGVK